MTLEINQLFEANPETFNKFISGVNRQYAVVSSEPIMKAIYLNKQGEAEALVSGDIAQPVVADGQALVKVHATAIMPTELDWYTTFKTPSGEARAFPIVLSHEFSGTIASTGPNVSGWKAGEAVYGLNDWFINGAEAEFCVCAATGIARKPATLRHDEAAIVPISALTAWQGLFERIELERGDRVLIHGAAGGVGTFAVQLARWRGAHVIATASAHNIDFVRALGADEVIDYKAMRFEEVVRGVHAVFDTAGGETLRKSWGVLIKGGKLVTVSSQIEKSADQRSRDAFMLVRADGEQLEEIGNLIDAGELRVFQETAYPIADAKAAYLRARRGGMRGKIALNVVQ